MAFGNNLAKVEKLFAGNSGSVSEHGAEANLSTDNKEVNKKHTYKTGALEGQSFHGLYHDYTGISGRVPAEVGLIEWTSRVISRMFNFQLKK